MTHLSPYIIPGLTVYQVTPLSIIDRVCRYHGIESADLFRRNRKRHLVTARQQIMWIMRTKQKMTLASIGKIFGYGHASVIRSVKMMTDLQYAYPEHRKTMHTILFSMNQYKTGGMRYFTAKEDKYLRANYLTIPAKRMAKNLGRSEGTARQRMVLLGLVVPREVVERFKKESQLKPGNIPANKGKTWGEFMTAKGMKASRKTTFKKGNLPPNTLQDGVITVRKDKSKNPYKFIRTSLGKWEAFQRVVWRKENGAIPAGSSIIFKDGDNLECLTRSELMKRNTVHNLPKPLAELVQLRGALNRKLNSYEKQNQRSA